MPHIIFSNIDEALLQKTADDLLIQLSTLLNTKQEAFMIELSENKNIINPQPICHVHWLPRPHLQLETAQLITNHFKLESLMVIFHNYEKSMFFVNGVPK